jgi:hypothetical protein
VNFRRDGTTPGKISGLETIALEEKSKLDQLLWVFSVARSAPDRPGDVGRRLKRLINLGKTGCVGSGGDSDERYRLVSGLWTNHNREGRNAFFLKGIGVVRSPATRTYESKTL